MGSSQWGQKSHAKGHHVKGQEYVWAELQKVARPVLV